MRNGLELVPERMNKRLAWEYNILSASSNESGLVVDGNLNCKKIIHNSKHIFNSSVD